MFTKEQLTAIVRNVISDAPKRRKRSAARSSLRAECERLEARRLLSASAHLYPHLAAPSAVGGGVSEDEIYRTYGFYQYSDGYCNCPTCDDDLDETDGNDGSGYIPYAPSGGDDGTNYAQAPYSEEPVDWATGVPVVSSVDLTSDGAGSEFGEVRTWAEPLSDGVNGTGWEVMQMPHIVEVGSSSTVVLVNSATDQRWFLNGGSGNLYTESGPFQDTLTTSGVTSGPVTITDDQGDQMIFNGFTGSGTDGEITEYINPEGVPTTYSYSPSGTLTSISRTTTVGSTASSEEYDYNYLPSTDPNAGLLQSVELERTVGSTTTAEESVGYTYYTNGSLGGNAGDLATATTATGGVRAAPTASAVTDSGSTLSPGNYYYVVTAVTPSGETGASAEAYVTVSSGQEVDLTWSAVSGATSYNIYRSTSSGAEQYIGYASSASYSDSGATATSQTPPTIDTSMYRYYTNLPVSSLTYSSGTVTAAASNSLTTGELVTIEGALPSAYDGTFTVTSATSTQFTYALATNPGTASGTIDFVAHGYTNGLEYVLGPQADARLIASLASGTTAFTVSNSQVATFADNYFEYQQNPADGTDYQVTKEVVQGQGCSCTGNNGQGAYTYSYSTNPYVTGSTDYNTWQNKVIQSMPDGNTYTVYTNFAGQVMMTVYTDTSSGLPTSGEVMAWYTRYDGQGRAILSAQPSAIDLPSSLSSMETNDDLVGYDSGTGSYQYLNSSSGLINLTNYYSAVGWQFSGTAGIAANGASIDSTTVPSTSYGTQAAFVTGTASLTETITGWSAGTYNLTFSAAYLGSSGQGLQISVDSSSVGSPISPASGTYAGETSANFTVSAGTHTITITGTAGGDTAMLDNLAINAVSPSPAPPPLADPSFEAPSLASSAVIYDPAGTTATSSTAGGVTGYFDDSEVEQGYSGTPILQESKTYLSQGGSISGVYPERYPMATDTVYQDNAGTVPETTSYAYTWQGTTLMPATITTTLPAVTTSQNGSNSSITSVVYVDSYGRVVWSQNGDGYIDYTAYDPNGTGAIIEEVTDVNPSSISSPPVAGPTRSGGLPTALGLTTTYTVDGWGRTTEETSPAGNSTYYIFNDPAHEELTYPGWHEIPGTSDYTTTGPETITREYRASSSQASGTATSAGTTTTLTDSSLGSGSWVGLTIYIYSGTDAGDVATVTGFASHTLTFSPAFGSSTDTTSKYVLYTPLYQESIAIAPPVETTSTPSGAETISASNIESLTRQLTNAGGETVEVDQYPLVSGLTYSQSATYIGGSPGTNYNETSYGYDDRGRQDHVEVFNTATTGTITDQVFDGLGRLLSTWTGTNDTGATWSDPGAGGGSNDMIKTEDDYYDTNTAPTPPTLTDTSGGSLAAATYYVRVTYLPTTGAETAGSLEASFAVPASHVLKVDSPASVGYASTYNVYVSTAAGAEVLQNGSPIAIGTNWTESTSGLTTGTAAVPVNGVGDGNLTEVVDHPNDGSPDRVTLNYPDWRDRIVAVKSGAQAPAVETAASPAVNRPLVVYTLDNLGEADEVQQYNGDGVMLTYSSGVPTLPSPAPTLVAESTASYDLIGQQYQTTTYSVTGGSPSTYGLVTNYYHDARGNLIETINPGGEVDKSALDGAGRDIADYVTDGAGGTSYADPVSLASDDVLSENLTSYDGDGNPTLVTSIDADQNNTTTGALATVTTNNEDRASYTAYWYDAADRMTDSADFGTDAGQQYSYQSLPPGQNLAGQATATGSTTTLVDSSLPEPANYFIGYTLSITAGTDSGHSATVTGYSAGGTITFSPAFGSATDSTSVYSLMPAAVTGTAASGTTTTLVDTSHLTQPAGSFVGWTLTITAGTDSGKTATVTANATSGTLTFAPAMASAIDSTSHYSLTLPALLNHTDYDSAGNPFRTTDPRGIATVNSYDLLGRTTQTVVDWNGGSVTSSTNQTTQFAYDGDNNLTLQTAVMPTGTDNQQTAYVYGVLTTGADPSDINSYDLLKTTEYPNPSTGVASTSASNDVTYSYNAFGEAMTMTDQNGTTHTYSHDVLGRLTADAVTTLGSGVNGSVRLHTYSFTPLGEPYLSSSYNGTTPSPTPTNQVEDVYNGLGQLTQEYQSHAGAVITTPTPTATASVTYAYSGLGSSSQNYSRLSSVTYPDGEVIGYGYNNSTLDNAISRVDFLSEGGSHVLDDTYLGLGTVASAAYEDGVTLSYFTSGSSASDSGDEYTNLDRFDRIIEQKYATTTPTPTTTDDFTYGYDADGDVLYQNVPIATSFGQLYHANSTTSGDNATAYDPLNRETAFRRGVLSASGDNGSSLDTVTTASVSDTYSLDALGNQAAVNSQNELTGSLLAYNNDGDQTENPAGGGYCTCDTYDAWNELVSYSSPSPSGTTCETMGYDALGREILDSYSLTSGVSGGDGKYYSADGQVVQDNCSCSCGCGCSFSSATTTDNFVWAPDYVNDLVLRDRTISGTTTRLYAQHDANFDVTALVNTSGTVTERLAYDPYGNVTVLTGAWGGSSDNTWQIRFQGMWLDNTTGLYKTLNRDYSSTEARWIEADPAGYIDGSDEYQFEVSDPSGVVDPTGLVIKVTQPGNQVGNGPTTNGQVVQDLLNQLSPDGHWTVKPDGTVSGHLPPPKRGQPPKFPASDQLVSDLVGSGQTVHIQVVPDGQSFTFCEGNGVRDPSGKPGKPGNSTMFLSAKPPYRFRVNNMWVPVPPRDVLAHELEHAREFSNGTSAPEPDPAKPAPPGALPPSPLDVDPSEAGAQGLERVVEVEHGDPVRPADRNDVDFPER